MYVLTKKEIEDGIFELLLNGQPVARGTNDVLMNFGSNIVNLCVEYEGENSLICG